MKNDPLKSLMSDAACRSEVLSSVGRQLEQLYSPVSAPMPERMASLMRQLSGRSYDSARNADETT